MNPKSPPLLQIRLLDDDHKEICESSSYQDAHNAFCKVKETLTRIGTRMGNTLTQECYILHRRGEYFLCHYTELKLMDGLDTKVTVHDLGIRNKVAEVLSNWDMIKIDIDISNVWPKTTMGDIMVIPFRDIKKYELISPYQIGVK